MKTILKTFFFALVALGFASMSIAAAEHGSINDAVNMVKKAKAYMATNSKDKALAEFNNPKGEFVDRDIYIFAYDKAGNSLANGGNPAMVGKNLIDLKDPDGVYIVKGLLDVAQKGGGKFDFKFMNPTTKKVESKTGYV